MFLKISIVKLLLKIFKCNCEYFLYVKYLFTFGCLNLKFKIQIVDFRIVNFSKKNTFTHIHSILYTQIYFCCKQNLTLLLRKVGISTHKFISVNCGKWIYSTALKKNFLCYEIPSVTSSHCTSPCRHRINFIFELIINTMQLNRNLLKIIFI